MLIGLVGRFGSGKGTVAKILNKKGFNFVVFSDFIAKELEKLNIPSTRTNLQDFGDEIRKKEGGGAWVKRILQEIDLSKNHIFDGVRNPGEIEELKKTGKFVLIYVDCLQNLRWQRLQWVNKEKIAKTWEEFLESEKRDAGLNQPAYGQRVDDCIKLADFIIVNNFDSENLKSQVEDILKRIKEKC